MTEQGWIPVEPRTLATRFPNVYAVGDVTSVGTAKAGVFAEGAGRVVADQLIARLRGDPEPPGYDGTGTCYIEFGDRGVGSRRRGLLLDPGTRDGHVHRALGGDHRGEGGVRHQPSGSLVRGLIPHRPRCIWGGSPTPNRGAPPSA